jgi:hypothetical protein
MKPPEEIKRLIHESEITTSPEADERILSDALNELEKRRREKREPLDAALWRAFMKNRMTKLGTAFVVIIAAVAAFQFLGNPFGSKLTFASVIEPIMDADTAAYDIIFGPEDSSTRAVVHELVMGSRIRARVAGGNDTNIIDLENRRMLSLNGANMEARYYKLEGLSSIPNFLEAMKDTIQTLQDSPDFTVEDLGRKKLDGKEVVGFYASNSKVDITIWADVDTGVPVHIEQIAGQQMHIAIKNIEFDLPMQEDLFSMEIPAGYTVQESTTFDYQAGTEANFIKGLRMIAERLNDGFFPDNISIDDIKKWISQFGKRITAMNLPDKEAAALEQQIFEYMLFIGIIRGEEEWVYRGKGVRLGEARIPILWYRPEKSETYRVIYGDLHVEDVYPENLPE